MTNECRYVGCQDEFESLKGRNTHEGRVHGKSKDAVRFECDFCGEEVVKDSSKSSRNDNNFCSRECWLEWKHSNPEQELVECKNCGQEFESYRRDYRNFYCSRECYNDWLRENAPTGEEHHSWKEGDADYYGENWLEMRAKALERDNYECVICKRGKEDLGLNPDVHHIIPLRKFDSPEDANFLDNLVTLCKQHHMMVEGWNLRPDTRDV